MNKFNSQLILENPSLNQIGIFTLQDAQRELAWPDITLLAALSRLTRSGKLIRIKRSLYCMRPIGVAMKDGFPPYNWFLIAKKILEDKLHYFSHYSAMHLHGMTGESIQTIFVSLQNQVHLPPTLKIPVRYVIAGKRAFWGLEQKWITNEEKINVSDLERTILDALDRLDLSGGIMEAARGIALVHKKINTSRLIEYSRKFHSVAAVKRLGFLMESLSIDSPEAIRALLRITSQYPSYALLDPTLDKKGSYLHRWRLIINFDVENLKQNLMT